jgi:hypothetical protein
MLSDELLAALRKCLKPESSGVKVAPRKLIETSRAWTSLKSFVGR